MPKYPSFYNYWPVCFEEHLVRAMQISCINPFIGHTDPEKDLEFQKKEKGMEIIEDFYEEINKSRQTSSYAPIDIIKRILERLDKKYCKFQVD